MRSDLREFPRLWLWLFPELEPLATSRLFEEVCLSRMKTRRSRILIKLSSIGFVVWGIAMRELRVQMGPLSPALFLVMSIIAIALGMILGSAIHKTYCAVPAFPLDILLVRAKKHPSLPIAEDASELALVTHEQFLKPGFYAVTITTAFFVAISLFEFGTENPLSGIYWLGISPFLLAMAPLFSRTTGMLGLDGVRNLILRTCSRGTGIRSRKYGNPFDAPLAGIAMPFIIYMLMSAAELWLPTGISLHLPFSAETITIAAISLCALLTIVATWYFWRFHGRNSAVHRITIETYANWFAHTLPILQRVAEGEVLTEQEFKTEFIDTWKTLKKKQRQLLRQWRKDHGLLSLFTRGDRN
ncbi:hypothetical protein KQI84_08275 [bacterium]|nr:hypothetical protein [bacterium]